MAAALATVVVLSGVLGLTTSPAGAATGPGAGFGPAVRLAGAAPRLPSGAVETGPTAEAETVTTDLALKPRDQAALDAFVAAVSTPGSPEFRHYLHQGQFASQFGPATTTVAAVRSWLASAGLQVGATSPDGLLVPVTGSVAQMERAFGVSVVDTHLASGRQARFVTSTPVVPSDLAPDVQGLIGLSTVALARPQIVAAQPKGSTPGGGGTAGGGTAVAGPRAVTPTPHAGPGAACAGAQGTGGYTADDIAATYGLDSLYARGENGSGITVGVYELEPYTPADITTYQACYGLTNSVTKVSVNGGATGAQSGEAALDIEDVAGLATGAAIQVYSGPQSDNGPIATYDKMVTQDTAQVLTTSWGICEPEMASSPGQQAAESSIFAEAAAQGQTVIAASGDSGSTDCYDPNIDPPDTNASVTVDDPADQPYVTGVGGTDLLGSGPSETVWNDGYGSGGGGVSSDFAQPAWQAGPGVGSSTAQTACRALGRSSCREVPDVAASADPAHGYAIFFSGHAGWNVYGGTSAASPVWAAMTAVIDQGLGSSPGLIDPVLYGAGTCAATPFNDVTSGSNAWIAASQGRYPATAAYDMATGWGSGNAGLLAGYLADPVACPVVTAVDPAKGPAAGGNTVTLTGTNFAGATAVSFGATRAQFSVTASGSLTTVVPAGPAGTSVDVTVQGPGGSSRAVVADRYTYVDPGYWLAASDGGIFTFGTAAFFGSTGALQLNRPVVGLASTGDDRGYWLVASDGGIFAFGDAPFYGSTGAIHLNKPIVGMAATPDGAGYWLVASDGGIFSFGDAAFYGSTGSLHLNQPIVGMAATPDGRGYWLVAADGGIFSFGDAAFHGSTGSLHLNKPIVGMAATPDGHGYWLVASDGGIFTFGDASFYGSTGNLHLNKPVVGMAATPDGHGYWLVASDGGIFAVGDARFYGSTGALTLNRPIVGMAST
jgi:hypothetical protein